MRTQAVAPQRSPLSRVGHSLKSRLLSALWLCLLALISGCQSTDRPEDLPWVPTVASVSVSGERLVIRLADGQSLALWPTDGALRYRIGMEGPLPAWAPLWEDRPANGVRWQADSGAWRADSWTVVPRAGGFEVRQNAAVLFRGWTLSEAGELRWIIACGPGERFYGLGGTTKDIELARRTVTVRQRASSGDQTYLHIPWVFTTGGDGFYFNTAGYDRLTFEESGSGRLEFSTGDGPIDGYFFHKNDLKALVADFYRWSAAGSLLPRWAYGFLQSKYGYRSTEEVLQIVERFQKEQIPLSAVVLDLYWFARMGDFDWDRQHWNPEALDAFLEERGVKTVAITEPYLTSDSRLFGALEKAGGLVKNHQGEVLKWSSWWGFGQGDGGMLDPLEPGGREILQEAYREMRASGIDGFWTDLGEPEESPPEGRFGPYEEKRFHNQFNKAWSALIVEALGHAEPDKRPFILSRSGFTGSGGLGVSVWSGDVTSTFKTLERQIVLGLSSGLIGLPYWGSDVGGFISRGLPSAELFVRWHQFGAFSPVYRAHGAQSPREPWIHDEATTRRVGDMIRLRKRLLPYIYTAAWQSFHDGVPMMRPIGLEFPDDPAGWEGRREYLFGDSLLVRPVVEESVREVRVRFPSGRWKHWWTGEVFTGPAERAVAVDLDSFPLFIREGAAIPLDDGERRTLLVWPGSKPVRSFWYEDDGLSEAYRRGIGELREIHLSSQEMILRGFASPMRLEIEVLYDQSTRQIGWEVQPGRENKVTFPTAFGQAP